MNSFEIIFHSATFSSNDQSPTVVFYDICNAGSSAVSAFWPFRMIFEYLCFLLFVFFLLLPEDSYRSLLKSSSNPVCSLWTCDYEVDKTWFILFFFWCDRSYVRWLLLPLCSASWRRRPCACDADHWYFYMFGHHWRSSQLIDYWSFPLLLNASCTSRLSSYGPLYLRHWSSLSLTPSSPSYIYYLIWVILLCYH